MCFFQMSWVLQAWGHRYFVIVARRIRRFFAAFEPIEVEIFGMEDLVHLMIHLGCAAYGGRVLLSRLGVLSQELYPLDFGSGSGVALHAAIGLLTWASWNAVCEIVQILQDDFANWRWSTLAFR